MATYTEGNIFDVFNDIEEKKRKPVKKAPIAKEEVKKAVPQKKPESAAPKKQEVAQKKGDAPAPFKNTKKDEQPQRRDKNTGVQKFAESRSYEKKPAADNWNEHSTWDTETGGEPQAPSSTKPRRQDINAERNDKQKGRRGERLAEEQYSGNKRPFERRSGTGRSPNENKKGGFGKNNWGVEGEVEFAEQPEPEKGEVAEVSTLPSADEIQDPTPKVEEKKEKLYTVYLAEQAKVKETLAALPQARRPGEGVDQSEWQTYTAIPREPSAEPAAPALAKKKPEKKEAQPGEKTEKPKSVKVAVEFRVRVPEDEERGDRRGGRGGDRGGDRGGRGGDRGRGGFRGGDRGDRRGGDRGDRGDRGGDRVERGDRADRGGDRAERGGDRADRGGDRAERGGDRAERGGDRADRGGDRVERGDRADRGGEERRNRPPRNDQQGGAPRDQQGPRRDENAAPRKQNSPKPQPKPQPNLELSDQNAFPSLT